MARYSVDYGHCLSGGDTGAAGNGYREENLTREVGKRVVDLLREKGHEVQAIDLQSAGSVRESLNYRINKINSFNPVLSVSIHFNAGGGTGSEVWSDGFNAPICNKILGNLKVIGLPNRGIKDGSDFAVVSVNPYAFLVECAFIDSSADMNKYDAMKFARAIANGIDGSIPLTENNNQNNNNEVLKVENIIQYETLVDMYIAEQLADKLNCPTINSKRPYPSYSQYKNVIAIGGGTNFSGYTNVKIAGKDRDETLSNAKKYARSQGKTWND
ncbi:N-acetylmuramoyl-L-alanine amidase [Clostridium gasigenes]|uniref:N-acetylmuramoyl-L-alanine amidase n=1 Tax=Clostridium gasigenes TaxID=94869 RepID=UPI001438429B|nr:N-acetylmuramoyl-L-alanine amidase [Clostridium gasigenes]NKF05308.1 N-acetylmuramoyl-L-alanine amidase [Clostridium gasigenes]QSW18762.1 N-acetylmuramoyl-L-alanine amidase [Clostridium gasigenes]